MTLQLLIKSYENTLESVEKTIKIARLSSLFMKIAMLCYLAKMIIAIIQDNVDEGIFFLLINFLFVFLLHHVNMSKSRSIAQREFCKSEIRQLKSKIRLQELELELQTESLK